MPAPPWQGLLTSGSHLPFSFLGWLTYRITFSSLLYLRIKKNLPRPYKVDFRTYMGFFFNYKLLHDADGWTTASLEAQRKKESGQHCCFWEGISVCPGGKGQLEHKALTLLAGDAFLF